MGAFLAIRSIFRFELCLRQFGQMKGFSGVFGLLSDLSAELETMKNSELLCSPRSNSYVL